MPNDRRPGSLGPDRVLVEGDPVEHRLQPLYHIGIFVSAFATGAAFAGVMMLVVQPVRLDWFAAVSWITSAVSGLLGAVGVAELLIRYLTRRKARRADSRRA